MTLRARVEALFGEDGYEWWLIALAKAAAYNASDDYRAQGNNQAASDDAHHRRLYQQLTP